MVRRSIMMFLAFTALLCAQSEPAYFEQIQLPETSNDPFSEGMRLRSETDDAELSVGPEGTEGGAISLRKTIFEVVDVSHRTALGAEGGDDLNHAFDSGFNRYDVSQIRWKIGEAWEARIFREGTQSFFDSDPIAADRESKGAGTGLNIARDTAVHGQIALSEAAGGRGVALENAVDWRPLSETSLKLGSRLGKADPISGDWHEEYSSVFSQWSQKIKSGVLLGAQTEVEARSRRAAAAGSSQTSTRSVQMQVGPQFSLSDHLSLNVDLNYRLEESELQGWKPPEQGMSLSVKGTF